MLKATGEIDSYMKVISEEINEITNDYKGFVNLEDKNFFEKQKEETDEELESVDRSDRSESERYVSELKRERDRVKLSLLETEADLLKASQKEKIYRGKAAELQLTHDEAQHTVRNSPNPTVQPQNHRVQIPDPAQRRRNFQHQRVHSGPRAPDPRQFLVSLSLSLL